MSKVKPDPDLTDVIIDKINKTIQLQFPEYNLSEKTAIIVLWCNHNAEKVMFVLTHFDKQLQLLIENIITTSPQDEIIDWPNMVSTIQSRTSEELFDQIFQYALMDLSFEMIQNASLNNRHINPLT